MPPSSSHNTSWSPVERSLYGTFIFRSYLLEFSKICGLWASSLCFTAPLTYLLFEWRHWTLGNLLRVYCSLSGIGHCTSAPCGAGSCPDPCDPRAWPGLRRAPRSWPLCKLERRRHLADLEGHRQAGWVEKWLFFFFSGFRKVSFPGGREQAGGTWLNLALGCNYALREVARLTQVLWRERALLSPPRFQTPRLQTQAQAKTDTHRDPRSPLIRANQGGCSQSPQSWDPGPPWKVGLGSSAQTQQ